MLALAAEPASARLDPVLDRPYRLSLTEERSAPGRRWHFGAERRVIFRRDGRGLIAEVTLLSLGQDMGGEAGRRFEAASAALRGRTVRFVLSDGGELTGIEDEAAVWTALTAGMALSAGGRTAAATALDALPPAARWATIASMILPVIAGADAGRRPGSRAIVLPNQPVAPGAPLTGHEEVTVGADALLHVAVHADAATGEAAVSLDRERVIDVPHGLVVRQEETQTTRLGGAVQVTRKTVTLTPVS